MNDLTIEQRFALTRARYEVQKDEQAQLRKNCSQAIEITNGAEKWSAIDASSQRYYF